MRPAERLRYLVLAAQREGQRQLSGLLSTLGLTPAQSEALRILADHGPLALRALGGMLVCDTGTSPSRIADRLVSAGLVERTVSSQDRRQVQLALTPAGEEIAHRVAEIENGFYDAVDRATDASAVQGAIDLLDAITRDSPAGRALTARLTAEERTQERAREA